jgi:hypothetical protein
VLVLQTDTLSLTLFCNCCRYILSLLRRSLIPARSLQFLHILWHIALQCAHFTIPKTPSNNISIPSEERNAFLVLIFITASALATSILPRPLANDCFRRPSILHAFDLPAIKTPPATYEDKQLPSIGHDRSRPSSSSTVASYTQQQHGSHSAIQLPALSTLASVASNSPPAHSTSNDGNSNLRRDTPEQRMPSPPRYVDPHKARVVNDAFARRCGCGLCAQP